ncbi:hypothetical protein F7725_027406 [Dissostichus mawsoni]|uniref:Ankyrin repeat domain 24 n=1 Tax=Dissostichus mawsoni TaxID=36200 RepID=A0A7J5XEW6_DISMA|nr:hypothetical protein F7725_027406 [Dissostichus mawsoni]
MKSLKAKFKKTEICSVVSVSFRVVTFLRFAPPQSQDWCKSDERLLQAVEQNEPDKVSALIVKKGLCPTKLDGEGKSAFHLSASRGRLDCLEVIIAHGADVNITDGAGFSALHLAAKHGQSECLKRLLQDGETPLILAAQMSRVELCVFLLGRGANANIQDNQGRSALMLACESDSIETVEALLRGGANTQLEDALGHNAIDYSITTGNQLIIEMLQNGVPPGASSVQGGTTPRKRKAPPPPRSPLQAEDEEVFEEIRRLRQERGRLLQKIKALEQQHQSALSALEELSELKQRLEEAEAERDRLLEELKGGDGIGASDSEDMDEMFDFPEKLLSKRSRASPAQDEESSRGDSADPSPVPRDSGTVAELHKHIEELTSQNSELTLKVQMLEMFEKDDTDMQTSSTDFVPIVQYETLRKEFEVLQERLSAAQASDEASSVAEEREEAQQLRARVTELEEELAEREGQAGGQSSRDSDKIKQLTEKVEELRAALSKRKEGKGEEGEAVKCLRDKVAELEAALAESKTLGKEGGAGGDGDQVRRLQERLGQLEGELRQSVPRSELEEVQVNLGLQCEQLARERAEVARRLNVALLDLERFRPPPRIDEDEEEEEEEEERSESSERSALQTLHHGGEGGAGGGEAGSSAGSGLSVCGEGGPGSGRPAGEGRRASVQTQGGAVAVSEQLADTLQELQEEKSLRAQAEEQTATTEAKLKDLQEAVPKEEHEKVKTELQQSLQASQSSAAAAQEALHEKDMELREMKSQKAAEQGLISKEDHEALRLALQAEINAAAARFNDLTRKHEKTCTEVCRGRLSLTSERQAAESQLNTITELSKDVFRLKEALGALSPPLGITSSSSSSSAIHQNNPGQQMALQNRIAILTQQLQGRMDEEVQGLYSKS